MTTPTIHDILLEALLKIREEHGVAVYSLSALWIDTADTPACAATQIHFEARAAK